MAWEKKLFIENKYLVIVDSFNGEQKCPFEIKDYHKCGYSSMTYLIINSENGKFIRSGTLVTHMIREHNFLKEIRRSELIQEMQLNYLI